MIANVKKGMKGTNVTKFQTLVIWIVVNMDNVNLEVELIVPIAMEKELRFAIREGGKTVGAGLITGIIE